MKITLSVSGGFAHIPGLSKPFTVDTTLLDPKISAQLEFLVHSCQFFQQAASAAPAPQGAADFRTYSITVEDGARIHNVQLIDPIRDADLERLVSALQSIARAATP